MTLRISSLARFSAPHVPNDVHSGAQSFAASNFDAQDVLVSALQQDVEMLADLGPFYPPF